MKIIKKRTIILCILAVLLGILAIFLLPTDSFLTTTYTIKSAMLSKPIRIAHLSDVHNKEYGEANVELIQAVKGQNPDLIFITGDSVSMEDEDVTPAVSLVEALVRIAPVYYSYGNHEVVNDMDFNRKIGSLFEEAGARVMDFTYEDIRVKDQNLRIGGLYGYCLPEKYLKTGEAKEKEVLFLKEFQNTEHYTLLLTHLPVCWLENGGLEEWDVDCVFSGHSHGGQFNLPFLGPVYAPDQGWFPDRVSGLFVSEDGSGHMVVSRGLGDSVNLPRINNDPELVIVELLPE